MKEIYVIIVEEKKDIYIEREISYNFYIWTLILNIEITSFPSWFTIANAMKQSPNPIQQSGLCVELECLR